MKQNNSLEKAIFIELFYLPFLLLIVQLTESETVSRNCRRYCEEQGIVYFRFNPKLEKVPILINV